jgi:hypothetical protein
MHYSVNSSRRNDVEIAFKMSLNDMRYVPKATFVLGLLNHTVNSNKNTEEERNIKYLQIIMYTVTPSVV